MELQFELDRGKRAHHGYVPTRTEWVPAGGVYSLAHLSWLAGLLGIHASLRVTYTLEDAAPDEKGRKSSG